MKKRCVYCAFFDARTNYCTVHQKEVEPDDACGYWAQETEFDPSPNYDYYRDAPREEELLYQSY